MQSEYEKRLRNLEKRVDRGIKEIQWLKSVYLLGQKAERFDTMRKHVENFGKIVQMDMFGTSTGT
jgi:hypothetical protein